MWQLTIATVLKQKEQRWGPSDHFPWNGDAQSLQAILSIEGANKKQASENNKRIAFETREKDIEFLCINQLTVWAVQEILKILLQDNI